MNVSFTLTKKQRNLILKKVPSLHPELTKHLSLGVVSEGGLDFELSEDLFEDLLDALELALEMAEDPQIGDLYAHLCEYVDDDEDDWDEDDPDDIFGPLSPEEDAMVEEFRNFLADKQPESIEEAALALQEFLLGGDTPLEECDGLTAAQMTHLGLTSWDAPDSVVVLHPHLPADMLENIPAVDSALAMLQAVNDAGGVKVVSDECFNKKFIKDTWRLLADEPMPTAGEYDEEYFMSICRRRVLLMEGGYMRKIKGHIKLTKKGEKMLKSPVRGELLARMFECHFDKFALSSWDDLDECEGLEMFAPFILLMIQRHISDWKTITEVFDIALPSVVQDELAEVDLPNTNIRYVIFYQRVLKPLEEFQLLESFCPDDADGPALAFMKFRKTPLFDRLIEFRL